MNEFPRFYIEQDKDILDIEFYPSDFINSAECEELCNAIHKEIGEKYLYSAIDSQLLTIIECDIKQKLNQFIRDGSLVKLGFCNKFKFQRY